MASISFTDSLGAATLDNGITSVAAGVGSRFRNWVPFINPIGPAERSLATGQLFRFQFRTDYGASFIMEEIPNDAVSTAIRLIAHLKSGGTCSVTTGDSGSRVYSTCGLAPDTEPELSMMSSNDIRYSLSLSLINLADTPAAMLCVYSN